MLLRGQALKMSKHKYGLLLSQLLDCISRPLEEEQVWALCHETCQSLLNYKEKSASPGNGTELSYSGITFEVDTIYLRRDGKIVFILNDDLCKVIDDNLDISLKQVTDLSKVLSACLENGSPKEFLRRQVGSDLESLMRYMSLGEFPEKNARSKWAVIVADCCFRHASSQNVVAPSEYYRGICEMLVKEGLEMNNFVAVVMTEIMHCESRQDAFSTFQLSQARPVISNWLQCMSEIREDTAHQPDIVALHSPAVFQNCYKQMNSSQSSALHTSPPRDKSSIPEIEENLYTPGGGLHLSKPSYHSTPAAVCQKTRKVLRPPQRLVNQVTSWMLEGETEVNSSCSYDVSWFPEQQFSHVSSSLGWFHEAKRIRRVLTELKIDTAMDDEALYKSLRNEEICFCCQFTKFSLFHRSCIRCEMCERRICSSCIIRIASRDLKISSHDSGMSSRDFECCSRDEIENDKGNFFRQIRKAFKPKTTGGEKYSTLCKDCMDFIQRYF